MSNYIPASRYPQNEESLLALALKQVHNSIQRVNGTALASAARTANTQSGDISGVGFNSLIVYFACTAASGTGGLTIRIRAKNPLTGAYNGICTTTVPVLATDNAVLLYGRGMGAGAQTVPATYGGFMGGVIPETFRIEILHADASSYTYSVAYELAP